MSEWDKNTYWTYEKLGEDGKIKSVGVNYNDYSGEITGRVVFGVKEWFDENPGERVRLGWTKHIKHSTKFIDYDRQTQYLERSVHIIDDYTVEDVYTVREKTEDMMRRTEESWDGEWISVGEEMFSFGE